MFYGKSCIYLVLVSQAIKEALKIVVLIYFEVISDGSQNSIVQ